MIDWSDTQAPRALHYFEELCGIPHPSFHTKAVSDYCVTFAREHGLECRQDESGNVVIKKTASPGREKDAVVLLQGHLDMVPAVAEGKQFDFAKEPITLKRSGDVLSADGTSLGGDDGIAVAMCLAILEDDALSHPPLICVFTTEEEVGLLGASALDMSDLQAEYMINLDSEAEGVITVSCAGGATAKLTLPFPEESRTGCRGLRVELTGLTGGHSGAEIDRGRTNGIRLLAEILAELLESVPETGLSCFGGGNADNAIPSSAYAVVQVPEKSLDKVKEKLEELDRKCVTPVAEREPGAVLRVSDASGIQTSAPAASAREALRFLLSLPNGVQNMSADIEGLVQTSLNLGVAKTEENRLILTFSVRSSVEAEKRELLDRLIAASKEAGGTAEISGEYPGWPVKTDSRLTTLASELWKEQNGEEARVEAIHAGLECGLFSAKIPDMDIISIGPDMKDIHTAKETLSLASTGRIWDYVCELLARLH